MLEAYVNEENKVKIEDKRLIATEYIKPGTTVFIEPALGSVPLPSKRHQRCNYCLKKAKLQCCSRCRSAYFCSNECFRNAWLHFHRVLCEPQETDIYKNVDADRWLLERIALILHSHERLNKQQSHSPPHLPFAIQALQLHTPVSYQSEHQQEKNAQTVKDISKFLEAFDCQISIEDLDVLWQRIQKSSFPISDPEYHMEQVAVGVYPITSLIVSHSCRPNAALLHKQSTQYLITLEDILPGEPITIAYVDLIATKDQRTKALQERFGPNYVCHCVRCEGEFACIDAALEKGESLGMMFDQGYRLVAEHLKTWSILDMVKLAESQDEDNWSSIQTLEPPQFSHFITRIAFPDHYRTNIADRKALYTENTFKLFLKEDRARLSQCIPIAMESLLKVPQVPAFSLATIRAAEQLLLQKMAEGAWVETSRCALYLNVVYRILYPPLHPKVAYHTLIMARSAWNALVELELIGVEKKLERIYANGTKGWIELAREMVNITFGKKSALWRDAIELQWVYERERVVKNTTNLYK